MTSPHPRKPDFKTDLTVNTDAVIIVSPLIWRKRDRDREGQARDKAVLLEEKGLRLGQAPEHSECRISGQPSALRPQVTGDRKPQPDREHPERGAIQRRLPFSHT